MSDMLEFQRVMSKSFSLAGNMTDSWRLLPPTPPPPPLPPMAAYGGGGGTGSPSSSSGSTGRNEQQWYA